MYKFLFMDNELSIETAQGLFSPAHPDNGTVHMLETACIATLPDNARVLDLGCGAGIVGITIAALKPSAAVIMTDNDPVACRTAAANLSLNNIKNAAVYESDGFSGLPESGFDIILSNPPYHTDFSVAKKFIEGSFKALNTNGRLVMVTKRLDWYRNKLAATFGGVKVQGFDDGYFVFASEKRSSVKPQKKANQNIPSKKLQRRLNKSKN